MTNQCCSQIVKYSWVLGLRLVYLPNPLTVFWVGTYDLVQAKNNKEK